MTTPESTALLLRIAVAVEGLRDDLARREERRLKEGGHIPGGSAQRATGGAAGGNGGLCFGNFGRSKNQPIAGATRGDLEYYAASAQRSIDDPGKARFHEKERRILAAINAELRRQSGGGQGPPVPAGEPPDEFGLPLPDEDVPFVHCGGIR